MAPTTPESETTTKAEAQQHRRIRYWAFTVLGVFLLMASLLTFLISYSGFHDWRTIDSNLSMFVAVNVNIVVLAAAFYMILRNLFRLMFERHRPLAGVRLKTKLTIALVALSIPSTMFHLVASGYMAYLLEHWSQGAEKKLLSSAEVVMDAMAEREDQMLRLSAGNIMAYLPHLKSEIDKGEWLADFRPSHRGGVVVFDEKNNRIMHWASGPEEMEGWQMPPQEYFSRKDGFFWKEIHQTRILRRFLMPIPNSQYGLTMEVFEVVPPKLAAAEKTLAQERINNRFVSRDLFWWVLSILITITLLIILAATWVSIYLARGFVTPIEQLADGTRLVSEGKLGYQVDHTSLGPLQEDFRGLVQSFNQMSRQLKGQHGQLLETTENLRHSHQKLGERNQLVELLLENVDAGILSLDPGGNITAMNRAAVKLTQARGGDWTGRNYHAVLGKDFAGLLDSLLERMRHHALRQVSAAHTVTPGRKASLLDVGVLSLESSQGEPEGVVVMMKDATAEQRKQRALAWREVARRVAHEIKNPLTPIQLSAQRIKRKYVDHDERDVKVLSECTETIIREVSSLKKMVNEFSRFAKLPETDPVPQSLNQIIREVAQSYQTGMPEQITLDLKLDEQLPPLPLDREQMKRVFNNLIDNAMASIPTSEEGRIVVSTKFETDREAILVEVSDTGHGVPDQIRERLFEPYTSTKEGGTGLGLAIVNQIVSDHHGYIRHAENQPSGSVFSIEFTVPAAVRSA